MDATYLKLEALRQSTRREWFVQEMISDRVFREEVLQCIWNLDAYPYKEYASWMLIHLLKSKKIDGQALYPQLVDVLFKTEDQSVLRNVVCSLDLLKITDYRESELIDLLISFIQNSSNKVALQVYSMRVLVQFCHRYPELKSEIEQLIALNSEGKTAAYRSAQRFFMSKTKSL